MILATVGTQLPFPRMIEALDRIAGRHSFAVFAQTADRACGARHLDHAPFLAPDEFTTRARTADLLVGHAGIGTVLTAKRLGKPLIVYPRRFALGEHRNDHQMATAHALAEVKGIYVAWDDAGFEDLLTAGPLAPASMEESDARRALVARLRAFAAEI
ncbi:hypothetical protein GCM10023232_21490 [Sphingosinicella ginsenosidimutans]|uniref:Glucuronosyltransferase n=1 Tax=Allosphingosinicella ginsenosidimutans TaxID=1176539 RepID=A0A5C6TT78_9SPHN|nr:glycosyltransferase [Sphingosinicella ginsenosidimutans]TXC63390.1 glucuronosyltransferase [Sphingosinicella ginsenosidimutans]